VTFKTKTHTKRLGVIHFFHLVNAPVTLYATHSSVHMDGMVEINIIRSFVDADPRDGRPIVDPIAIYILFV
jgi:hypothetical protein